MRPALAAPALAVAALVVLSACRTPEPAAIDYAGPTAQWPEYGGDKGGAGYSPLTQIDRHNVARLRPAWVYRHGDYSDGKGAVGRTSFQARPVVVGETLFFCTGYNRVIALHAETGAEKWIFDPAIEARAGAGVYPLTCRGVAYWLDPKAEPGSACRERIFTGTRDAELIALDAADGRPCRGFGDDGRVSLREGLGEVPPYEYYPTSPPLPVGDVVVVGALVADNQRVGAPPGVVRAFDARSGALRWAWDPVPPGWTAAPSTGARRYELGTPNVWSMMSADEERGIVYLPTGNPSPDLYAAGRRGLDFYGSSTVALDAKSGRLRWFFQTVHSDVWDYDVASQPALFEIDGVADGAPALAQATKMGHVFLLDRTTGAPLYPVEERRVPASDVPGEVLSPTQPFPTRPPPLHPATLTPDDAWGFTPFDKADCADRIAGLRSEGIFTPPSLGGSVQFPGSAGGANWGGVSIDPERGLLFVNQMHSAAVVTLIPRERFELLDLGAAGYPNELYPMFGTPYGVKREPLLSSFGAPCNAPPWGTLTAVDLVSGRIAWSVRLGTTRDQAPWPLWLDLGAPNLGGSVATAGGVVFIAATTDKFLRAFDSTGGDELWTQRLPFTANSSPVTYRLRSDSRQFVVIAAGGHGWSEPGDALMAFALPAGR